MDVQKRVINIIKKILIIMLIFQITFIPVTNAFSLSEIFNMGDEFLELGEDSGGQTVINTDQLSEEVGGVYNIIFAIGIALSVLVGAILGIKFITGSVEEQAKVKEMLIPYIIGCIVVFGAFGIWKIAVELGDNIFVYEKEDYIPPGGGGKVPVE